MIKFCHVCGYRHEDNFPGREACIVALSSRVHFYEQLLPLLTAQLGFTTRDVERMTSIATAEAIKRRVELAKEG